jgi:hypothetical protein
MSRERNVVAKAEPVTLGEGNMSIIDMREDAASPWSMAILRKDRSCRNLGSLVIGHKPALVRIGKTMSRSR